jgi:hypothetical protein
VITSAVLGLLTSVAELVLDVIPDFTLPSWFSSLPTTAGNLGSMMGGFGNWIPWGAILQVLTTVVGLVVTVIGVRVALWVWSKVPWIGGS